MTPKAQTLKGRIKIRIALNEKAYENKILVNNMKRNTKNSIVRKGMPDDNPGSGSE